MLGYTDLLKCPRFCGGRWAGRGTLGFYDTVRETRYHDDLWFFHYGEMRWVRAVLPENSARPRCVPAPLQRPLLCGPVHT
jgi:hypothetical protein